MAVDFLTAEQKAQYGQFAGDPDEQGIFTLTKQT